MYNKRYKSITGHAALSDQAHPSPYMLHSGYYLKDRDTRPKVWRHHGPKQTGHACIDLFGCCDPEFDRHLHTGMVTMGMATKCAVTKGEVPRAW